MRAVSAALFLLLLAGCRAGPDYVPPPAGVPPAWAVEAPAGVQAAADAAVLARWWEEFADAGLDALVRGALEGNRDLAAAGARVREARALRAVAAADGLPQVGFAGDVTRTRRSANSFPAGPVGQTNDLWVLGLDASWEPDVFGRIARSVEAAEADLAAAEEDRRAVLVSLLGDVGREWVEARTLQRRLAIARDALRTQGETADLTRARRDAGLANDLDVARAEALVADTQASLPALELALAGATHRLDVLLGRPPGAAAALLGDQARVPPPPPRVPLGLPSELLQRRPDLRRAERELAAATARIGVAQAARWPSFQLTGAGGLSSQSTGDLLSRSSRFWQLGAGVDWPLLDGGRLAAGVEVADARAEQALHRWEQAVLVALRETHDALVAFGREQERQAALARSAESQRRAAGLARERHAAGLSDFLDVLDAERTLLSAEDELARSEQALATAAVSLYRALGGGWEAPAAGGEGGVPAAP